MWMTAVSCAGLTRASVMLCSDRGPYQPLPALNVIMDCRDNGHNRRRRCAFRRAMTVERLRELSVLTLILYDIIPNDVRSARGRSHEASCGWDRMRRPRPGGYAPSALGRRRSSARRPIRAARQEHGQFGGRHRPPAPSPMREAWREKRTAPAKRGRRCKEDARDGAP